jgi:RNA polymerase sigma-70 factor (ECF subfamily)
MIQAASSAPATVAASAPRTRRHSIPAATTIGAATKAAAVAETLSGRARAARPALVGGSVGLVWAPGGQPRVAFEFTIVDGRIAEIALVADPERIRQLDPSVLEG